MIHGMKVGIHGSGLHGTALLNDSMESCWGISSSNGNERLRPEISFHGPMQSEISQQQTDLELSLIGKSDSRSSSEREEQIVGHVGINHLLLEGQGCYFNSSLPAPVERHSASKTAMCCCFLPKPTQKPNTSTPNVRDVTPRRLQRMQHTVKASRPIGAQRPSAIKEIPNKPRVGAATEDREGGIAARPQLRNETGTERKEPLCEAPEGIDRGEGDISCDETARPSSLEHCDSSVVNATLTEPFDAQDFFVKHQDASSVRTRQSQEPEDWSRGCRSTLPSVRRRLQDKSDKHQDTTERPPSNELVEINQRPATYPGRYCPECGRSRGRNDSAKRESWPLASRRK